MSFEHFPQPQETLRNVPPSLPKREITPPPPVFEHAYEREHRTERFVCLSDIHNDIKAMHASMRQRKLINEEGEWKHGVRGVHLMITGDSINKHGPNPEVLKYLHHLQKTAPEGCRVTVLVGNHELDILTRETRGEDVGLKEKRIDFFGKMQVVSKQGQILFLHRFPSLALVQELEAQYSEQNADVPDGELYINSRFQNAVATRKITPEESLAVFQECDDGGDSNALEGLTEKEYYEKHGEEIRTLLERMGVSVVVHGHRRQVTGGQHFEEYIPGIVMINNDTAMADNKNPDGKHRAASVGISHSPDGNIDINCVYVENTHSGNPYIQQRTLH